MINTLYLCLARFSLWLRIRTHHLTATGIKINIPPSGPVLRRSARHSQSSAASGSEYHASEHSMDYGDPRDVEEDDEEESVELARSSRGRTYKRKSYVESEADDEADADGDPDPNIPAPEPNALFDNDNNVRMTRASARRRRTSEEHEEDEMMDPEQLRTRRKRNNLEGFIATDDDEEDILGRRYNTRNRLRKANGHASPPKPKSVVQRDQRANRAARRNATKGKKEETDVYVDGPVSQGSSADGSFSEELPHTPTDLNIDMDMDGNANEDDTQQEDGRPYGLRERQKKINYYIPPPLEEIRRPPPPPSKSRHIGNRPGGGKKGKGLGWSASGAELGRWMGMPADDSDSDYNPTRTPGRSMGGLGAFGGAVPSGGAGMMGDLVAGTPSNLGKIGDAGKHFVLSFVFLLTQT